MNQSDYFTNNTQEIIDKLKILINASLDELYANDYHLIVNRPLTDLGKDEEHHVGERAIVFRFAHYLQNLIEKDGTFNEFNLDCEYNRNGVSTKKLPSFPNGTFPDVILHKRGNNDNNILIIEVKTYWNKDQFNDCRKIMEFTQLSGQFGFLYGEAILLEKSRDNVKVIEIVNGNIVKEKMKGVQ